MRIAHISDTHLLSLRNVNPLAFIGKRVTGGLNLLLNRGKQYPVEVGRRLIADVNAQAPDHVIVSGDVSNLSLPAEFELVREVLRGLSLPASEVTVVPGNHDCYTVSAAWRDDFARVLAPFIKGDQAHSAAFPLLRLRGEVAIIALSTARVSLPLFALGTVGPRQLAATRELLGHPLVADKFRVIVLHHPPRSPHAAWHARLTDGAAFTALVASCGAELVLHGHLHRNVRDELPGPDGRTVPVIGVTSGTWLSPRDPQRRASYNLYEIGDGQLQRVTQRRYDLQRGAFHAA